MTLIGQKVLSDAGRRNKPLRVALTLWAATIEQAQWISLVDVRRQYPSADGVALASGTVITVFNVKGNDYRLLTWIEYDAQVVEALEVITHTPTTVRAAGNRGIDMPTAVRKAKRGDDPYLELILNIHPLRPIRTEAEHNAALKALRSLANDRRPEAVDFKKVLASIIASYEREAKHVLDTSDVSASDMVRHLLNQRGQSVNAFARAHGLSQGTLSDMLNGRRDWSKGTIVLLCDQLGLNPSVFLR